MARRALLVGVDVYPDPRNNLNSCVADTLAFKQMLETRYGFASGSVRLLHNSDATLANTLSALDALFAGAGAGDQIVFFQSSHGWRYPDGDTMVEVICLYDDFLRDTELVRRTERLPAGVLTAVLDLCHAGGMNKIFFPSGAVQIAKAKVWQPSLEAEHRAVQLYSQVTKFKFFGQAATADAGAVVKNFQQEPTGVPPAKDVAGLELNGTMLAACQADQTAAAGSPATSNLSAFTFALLQEVDGSVPVASLQQRVARRLDALNMSQVPHAAAPTNQPGLLTRPFLNGGTVGPTRSPSDGNGGGAGFDPWEYLRQQLGALAA